MIHRLISATKRALELHHPGRNLDVFPDDIFLVSYPKSGNTWTRFLVANLAYPQRNPDFSNINELIPDPEALSKKSLKALSRPRILKSHQYFDPRYQKVIYVVRDPRDVLLSEYHFKIKRRVIPDGYPVKDFVGRFLRNELGHPYGSWFENVGSWIYTRGNHPGFLLVHYEGLLNDPLPEMMRISNFLGVPAEPKSLSHAIEQSSADRMRALEKKQAHLWSSTKDTRLEKPFVRAAKAGGWRSALTPDSAARIEEAWGDLMVELGYELSIPNLVRSSGRP
jgi:hypothetical protein